MKRYMRSMERHTRPTSLAEAIAKSLYDSYTDAYGYRSAECEKLTELIGQAAYAAHGDYEQALATLVESIPEAMCEGWRPEVESPLGARLVDDLLDHAAENLPWGEIIEAAFSEGLQDLCEVVDGQVAV